MKGRVRASAAPLRPTPPAPHFVEHRTADGRRVFLHREVVADLVALERHQHPRETAGLLFGRLFTDGTHPCVLVRHLIWPEPGEVLGTVSTVTITAEGSTRMLRRALERHPCADPVGWAHTHPTFNAYFSATDRAEQAVWGEPASVGLVLSGLDDAEPPYEVFVGPSALPAEPIEALPWAWRPAPVRRLAPASTPPRRPTNVDPARLDAAEPRKLHRAAARRRPARWRWPATALCAVLVLILIGVLQVWNGWP
jgi:proteasome lid subunit RPN8/RPN11